MRYFSALQFKKAKNYSGLQLKIAKIADLQAQNASLVDLLFLLSAIFATLV